MSLPSPPESQLITCDRDLEELCERWEECSSLALDTEFIRTRTFYSKLGLVQVGDPEGLFLLDAVAITEWQPFIDLLDDSTVAKVLHSPSEDLELFDNLFGALPRPLVDTQVAATLASISAMPGCSRLVSELFEVELPKGQQRSDWLKRPLSESQKLYAGLDVAYLLPAWEILLAELERLDRVSWFDEEMTRLEAQCAAKNDPTTIYLRLLKSHLDEDQAGALFAVVAWREAQARDRDLPRRFVLGDDAVLELALTMPGNASQVEDLDGLGPGQKKRFGPGLLEVIDSAERRDLSVESIDFLKVSKAALKAVRACMSEVAEEEELPVEFLASKRALEKLIRRVRLDQGSPVPPELEGWRWELFGERLVSAISR